MAENVIAADYSILKQKSAELKALAGKVSGRPCSVAISSSKGAFAEEMGRVVAALNEVGAALTALANATAGQVDHMCAQFQEADAAAATQFSGGK